MMTHYWLGFSAEYKSLIKPLLHQQMWLFGRDILCPEGNLLYQHQFTHERNEERGGSMYTRWDGQRQTVLWGWGIWLGQAERGAIFVNRYKAKPQFTAVSQLSQTIHREKGLPRVAYRVQSEAEVEQMRHLWVDLLGWLADYEAWVLETVGERWRQASLKSFSHAVTKPTAVAKLASQWRELVEQSERLPIKSHTR